MLLIYLVYVLVLSLVFDLFSHGQVPGAVFLFLFRAFALAPLLAVFFCADLLFIRLYWGKQAWLERQTRKGRKTRSRVLLEKWGLVLLTTVVFLPLFSNVLMAISDIFHTHSCPWVSPLVLGGTLAGFGFIFCLSLFRYEPARLPGILTYGCLAVYLTVVFAIYSLPRADGHWESPKALSSMARN